MVNCGGLFDEKILQQDCILEELQQNVVRSRVRVIFQPELDIRQHFENAILRPVQIRLEFLNWAESNFSEMGARSS